MLALLTAARTLATKRIVGRGVMLGTLALAQRLLTSATAWVLFARPAEVQLAVSVALGAVFTGRTLLQRVLSSRTEADLMGRVIESVLDGDVLRASVLPEEDAQADLGHGVYFGAQQLSEVVPGLMADLVAALLLAVVVARLEPPRLVLGAMALTLVGAVGLMWSRGRVQRAMKAAWELRERVIDKMVDAVEARLEIVASGERVAFAADTRERTRAWAVAGSRAAGWSVTSGRIPLLLIAAAVGVALMLDSRLRGAFPVTLSDVALFASMTPAFAGVAHGVIALVQMEPSVRAVARVVDDARPRRAGKPPPASPASITFDDVSFRYHGADADVLTRVAFAWNDERVIALSGANGSGKSTCLRLLLALAPPRAGTVRVGGVDLSEVDADLWRRTIAFLPQRPYLPMRGDVRTAVRLFAPDASDDRITAALGRVDMIETLRRAGAAPLEVSVDTLSVGQRQRIALARMLCREASLYVLDEPDANLDRDGITLVARLVRELSEGHRVILAAHTPELLGVAQRVIQLDRGCVEQRGTEPRASWLKPAAPR